MELLRSCRFFAKSSRIIDLVHLSLSIYLRQMKRPLVLPRHSTCVKRAFLKEVKKWGQTLLFIWH